MFKSMTGYGKGETEFVAGRLTVEIRTVNHRYGEISVKMPRSFLAFENDVRKAVAARLSRGKIDVFIQQAETGAARSAPQVNIGLAALYRDAFRRLKADLELPGDVDLPLIVAQRDVVAAAEGEADMDTEAIRQVLLDAVSQAVAGVEAMRIREGAALLTDLQVRRQTIASLVEQVAVKSPQTVADAAVRLRERIAQLTGESGCDEARLAQEIALMADRSDITEEVVRFRSHLLQFDTILQIAEPVGRKLDFLMQEFNREANTIGSKANDAEIARLVVELKAELEKIREQVQNIE
ncbi:MAG TPA: YicC/YloC family endoribonuclease [Geobacteraceae bacterium]